MWWCNLNLMLLLQSFSHLWHHRLNSCSLKPYNTEISFQPEDFHLPSCEGEVVRTARASTELKSVFTPRCWNKWFGSDIRFDMLTMLFFSWKNALCHTSRVTFRPFCYVLQCGEDLNAAEQKTQGFQPKMFVIPRRWNSRAAKIQN